MIKARVIMPLNLRTGKPEILTDNNPADLYYKVGDTIEIVDGIPGEPYKNNNLWYRLSTGEYVWSGGVGNVPLTIQTNKLAGDPFHKVIDYYKDAFPEFHQHKTSCGNNIKIAVMDTGIDAENPSFANNPNIRPMSNVTSSTSGLEDIKGHGSHVAGLIAAIATNNTGISGIAPKATLYIYKAIDDSGSTSATNLSKALKLAINEKVDIINLSLDIAAKRYNLIEADINLALSKGIIIVAAAGENELLLNNGNLYCPSNKPGIIAVGSVDEYFLRAKPAFNQKLNYILPNNYFWSCSSKAKTYAAEKGSSMATAFVSGLISLIMASLETKDIQSILSTLTRHSQTLNNYTFLQTSLYKPTTFL